MGKLETFLVLGAAAAVGTVLYLKKKQRREDYNKATSDWMNMLSKSYDAEYEANYDLARRASANDLIDHYKDITIDCFKELLFAMGHVPNGVESLHVYTKKHFDALREQVIQINNACKAAVEAELSLLSNDYLDNLQSKPDYINAVVAKCDEKCQNRLDILVVMEALYNKRIDAGRLSDEESRELQYAINDFAAV